MMVGNQQRGKKIERKCACCGTPFVARAADVKRGWAKFCSKSCKAIVQEKRTGQNKRRLYESEYGGIAQFDSRGNYVGFTYNGTPDVDQ